MTNKTAAENKSENLVGDRETGGRARPETCTAALRRASSPARVYMCVFASSLHFSLTLSASSWHGLHPSAWVRSVRVFVRQRALVAPHERGRRGRHDRLGDLRTAVRRGARAGDDARLARAERGHVRVLEDVILRAVVEAVDVIVHGRHVVALVHLRGRTNVSAPATTVQRDRRETHVVALGLHPVHRELGPDRAVAGVGGLVLVGVRTAAVDR